MFMNNYRHLIVTVIALTLTACATPKRGDIEYAPVMPMVNYGPQQFPDAIYQPETAFLLTEDIRARRVGDMLTVTLQEQMDAQKTADTSTSKTTDSTISPPTIFGNPVTHNGTEIFDNSMSSDHAFDGQAESTQSNSLTGSITVTVVSVLANGYLVVQGEKWININQGDEYIRLRGIVRPSDINPDNSVESTRVANAQIQYSGNGALADSNESGWLARFFNSSWMPF